MLNSFHANDHMSVKPITFSDDTDIFDAIHELLINKASGGTVLNRDNEVIGVISEIDCLRAIISTGYYNQGGTGGKVKDYMSTNNIDYMDSNLSIVDAAQRMLETGRRRMPVLENNKFIGQISAHSLLQAFKDSVAEHDASENERP